MSVVPTNAPTPSAVSCGTWLEGNLESRLAGSYDEGEEEVIRAALERAGGYGPNLEMPSLVLAHGSGRAG